MENAFPFRSDDVEVVPFILRDPHFRAGWQHVQTIVTRVSNSLTGIKQTEPPYQGSLTESNFVMRYLFIVFLRFISIP